MVFVEFFISKPSGRFRVAGHGSFPFLSPVSLFVEFSLFNFSGISKPFYYLILKSYFFQVDSARISAIEETS